MKQNICLLILVMIFSYASCETDDRDIFNTEVVKVKATISHPNGVMVLGDTMKIQLTIPDTVVSNTTITAVQSLRRGQFYMHIRKIDTTRMNKATLVSASDYWTTKGIISPSNPYNFELSTSAKPYSLELNFKPTEKGIYYLEVASQAGDLKLNTSYDARLVVDFNIQNRNAGLATPYVGSAWATEAMTREFGIYVFRVN